MCISKDEHVPNFEEKLVYNDAHCRVRSSGRKPTDILCLLIFLAFWAGMVYISYVAYNTGVPARLVYPTDYMGRVCGRNNSDAEVGSIFPPDDPACFNDTTSAGCQARVQALGLLQEDLTQRPFLWFMELVEPFTYGGVCVSYCPDSTDTAVPFCPSPLFTTNNSIIGSPYCSYKRVDNNMTFPQNTYIQKLKTINYSPVLQRCAPFELTSSQNQLLNTTDMLGLGTFSVMIGDAVQGWRVLLVSAAIALVLAFVWIILLRFLTGVMVWVTILGVWAALAALGVYSFFQGRQRMNDYEGIPVLSDIGKGLYWFGIVVMAIAAVFALLVLLLCRRIMRAIAIIKETSKAVAGVPQVVFFPFFMIIIIAGFCAYWVAFAGLLWSAGKPTRDEYVVKFKWDTTMNNMFYYQIFGFFWTTQFLLSFMYCVIAGVIATWYWTRDKSNVPGFPLLRTIVRTLVFHLGTLAFGSLLVAVVQFLRFLLSQLEARIKSATKSQTIAKGLLCYCKCCLACLEAILKYINKQAFIQTAIYGTSFITSAKNACLLIVRNFIQIAVLDWVGNAVIFLGKVFIGSLTAFIAFFLCKYPVLTGGTLGTPLLIIVVVFIIAYIIANVFMLVFDTAIDTVLQSFLMDEEMSSQGKSEPYCTSTLRDLMNENRRLNDGGGHGCCC